MLYDKNGIVTLGDMYCHQCTGEFRLMRSPNTGKGRMVCRKLIVNPRYESPHYKFKCIECGYSRTYEARYQKDYGIK